MSHPQTIATIIVQARKTFAAGSLRSRLR